MNYESLSKYHIWEMLKMGIIPYDAGYGARRRWQLAVTRKCSQRYMWNGISWVPKPDMERGVVPFGWWGLYSKTIYHILRFQYTSDARHVLYMVVFYLNGSKSPIWLHYSEYQLYCIEEWPEMTWRATYRGIGMCVTFDNGEPFIMV